jgi:ribonuclease VapC
MRASLVVDSSALLAILFKEDDAGFYADQIAASSQVYLSAANWLESAIRAEHAGGAAVGHHFDDLVRQAGITIEVVTANQAGLARSAYRVFGKGNGHSAQLNFGDCFSYALAKDRNLPLLFKGQDFIHTDLETLTSG